MTTTVDRCADCNVTLGALRQETLPGVPAPPRYCIGCTTTRRAKMILGALPEEGDPEWRVLSPFEQDFLPSVRRQFAAKGTVSEKQYEVLERIWKRV